MWCRLLEICSQYAVKCDILYNAKKSNITTVSFTWATVSLMRERDQIPRPLHDWRLVRRWRFPACITWQWMPHCWPLHAAHLCSSELAETIQRLKVACDDPAPWLLLCVPIGGTAQVGCVRWVSTLKYFWETLCKNYFCCLVESEESHCGFNEASKQQRQSAAALA